MNIAANWIGPLLSEPFISSKYNIYILRYIVYATYRSWSSKHLDIESIASITKISSTIKSNSAIGHHASLVGPSSLIVESTTIACTTIACK